MMALHGGSDGRSAVKAFAQSRRTLTPMQPAAKCHRLASPLALTPLTMWQGHHLAGANRHTTLRHKVKIGISLGGLEVKMAIYVVATAPKKSRISGTLVSRVEKKTQS